VPHCDFSWSAGVTWVTVNGEGRTLAEAEQWVDDFGANVISAF